MFAFTDRALLDAVVAAHRRGVDVRVMLNAARRSGLDDNKATRLALSKAGIAHTDSNPAFGVTHEKSMVIDHTTAVVGSANWVTENLTATRDYAVVTTHRKGVQEVLDCFDADWHRRTFAPGLSAHLIWCPNDGRERIARFIDDARRTLFVQNERYQDELIIERIVRARLRGVKVHVMARPPHTLKAEKLVEGIGGLRIMDDVGIRLHTLKHLKLHGKMLLRDGARAIVGSINLAPGSFDDRRELAIEFGDRHIIDRLQRVAQHDWRHSHPMDLTDQGILDDLSKRHEGAAHRLALAVDAPRKRKGTRPARASD
jgi:phosphatidylserine/phosphatidylglycerophosphate/cardiolipin synthase-like enzyme